MTPVVHLLTDKRAVEAKCLLFSPFIAIYCNMCQDMHEGRTVKTQNLSEKGGRQYTPTGDKRQCVLGGPQPSIRNYSNQITIVI